jgi:uncharacterized protein
MSDEHAERPKWPEAVRQAMFRATEVESREQYGTVSPAFNYRWEHVSAVATLAMKLAQLVGADLEVVEAAAWLHDVAKVEGESHPEIGAAFARRFLAETDFPPGKIDDVVQAIAEHKGLWREEPLTTLESQVLWDADKLSKIGLTAAFQWTGMMLADCEPITSQELIERGRQAGWQSRTVDSMHTEPARQAAKVRLRAYRQFWDALERELAGRDLQAAGEAPESD